MDTIYIRVDMNPVIATGHVMRCLSIADEVRTLGGNVVFITADEYPLETIKNRGYEVVVLHSDWRKMDEELPQLQMLIEERKIDRILIDSYQVTENYLQILKKHIKVIYLDDLDELHENYLHLLLKNYVMLLINLFLILHIFFLKHPLKN